MEREILGAIEIKTDDGTVRLQITENNKWLLDRNKIEPGGWLRVSTRDEFGEYTHKVYKDIGVGDRI